MTDYPKEFHNLHKAAVYLVVNGYEILGGKCIDKPIIQVRALEGACDAESEIHGVTIITKREKADG